MLRRPTSRTEHCHASSLPSSSPCSTGVCQWGAGPATRPRQPAASRPCRVLLQAKPPSEDATATQRKTPTLPGDPHSSWRACPPPPADIASRQLAGDRGTPPTTTTTGVHPVLPFFSTGRLLRAASRSNGNRRAGARAGHIARCSPPPLRLCFRRGASARDAGEDHHYRPPRASVCYVYDGLGRPRAHAPPARPRPPCPGLIWMKRGGGGVRDPLPLPCAPLVVPKSPLVRGCGGGSGGRRGARRPQTVAASGRARRAAAV